MRRVAQLALCCLLVQGAFAQRGGGGRGGGGGGFRGGGMGGGFRGGGMGMRGGMGMGGFRGGMGMSGFRGGGFRGGGFRGGFRGNGFVRGGFGRFRGNRVFIGVGGGFFPFFSPWWGGGWGGGFYGGDFGYGGGFYPYGGDPYGYGAVAYPDQPAPVIVYQNPTYAPDTAPQPVIRDYGDASPPVVMGHDQVIYLIAFKDSSIKAALDYWVDADTLNFVTVRHEQKKVPLSWVDRSLSLRLNLERRVSFRLP